jgi:hydrogenase maturation protein HypF
MAVSYLAQHFGRNFFDLRIPFVEQLDRRAAEVVLRMIEQGVNSPLTSSCGRLFDAVAALAGIRQRVNYEAQAAIELEMAMEDDADTTAYPFELVLSSKIENRKSKIGSGNAEREAPSSKIASRSAANSSFEFQISNFEPAKESGSTGRWLIDTRPLFEALVKDLRAGVPASRISRRFHNGLVDLFARVAGLLRESRELNRVCLSGGTFQNVYLLEHLTARLRSHAFEVFTHSEVPTGDGGLSLGQALVAAHRVRA